MLTNDSLTLISNHAMIGTHNTEMPEFHENKHDAKHQRLFLRQ